MKKVIYLVLTIIVFSGCVNTSQKNVEKDNDTDTIVPSMPSADDEAALLERMSKKPLPENYVMVGELETDTLTYVEFGMGDLAHYIFTDSEDVNYNFNGNESGLSLQIDAAEPSEENGGYEANPEYLNRKFKVVWRSIKLDKEPSDVMEMYYQEFDQIIYLEPIG